jgi:hypothetical protein
MDGTTAGGKLIDCTDDGWQQKCASIRRIFGSLAQNRARDLAVGVWYFIIDSNDLSTSDTARNKFHYQLHCTIFLYLPRLRQK